MNFKEGLNGEKEVLEHHQTLDYPQRTPRVGGQLLGVRLSILHFKLYFQNNNKSSKFPIPINFTNPSRKVSYHQIYPKIIKTIYKSTQNIAT